MFERKPLKNSRLVDAYLLRLPEQFGEVMIPPYLLKPGLAAWIFT